MILRWTSPLTLAVSLSLGLLAGACARQVPLAPLSLSGPASADGSALCEGLTNRFIGLPGPASAAPGAPSAVPPLTGRWWIRSCSAEAVSGELRIRLAGPGWYFVDLREGVLALQQQVPFDLRLDFDGRAHGRSTPGLVSLWLEPTREPRVDIRPAANLAVRGRGLWGSLLSAVLPVRTLASKRFVESAASALRHGLEGGATLTYHIRSGQSDATIGKLERGQTPKHAFDDGSSWLVNDRLLLAPGATHVVGPLEPGTSELDVSIERGSGLAYRAVCVEDMDRQYPLIARGRASVGQSSRKGAAANTTIGARASAVNGSVAGTGLHQTTLQVERCKYYLVLSALAKNTTLAALRVRD
jgi:hypothetical protein